MIFKVSAQGAFAPKVDKSTKMMSAIIDGELPLAIRFEDRANMTRLAEAVLNAYNEGNDILILNASKLEDQEEFIQDIKGEVSIPRMTIEPTKEEIKKSAVKKLTPKPKKMANVKKEKKEVKEEGEKK